MKKKKLKKSRKHIVKKIFEQIFCYITQKRYLLLNEACLEFKEDHLYKKCTKLISCLHLFVKK